MGILAFFASRFVAGESSARALRVVQQLNARNVRATVDFLGEDVADAAETERNTAEYLRVMDEMKAANIQGHVSLKLSMLGLRIDESLCERNLAAICKKADDLGYRVAIDMEGTDLTEKTMQAYERAARQFKAPEIVLQAYLHRTPADIERVLALGGKLRLCKGAYKEPASLAFQNMNEIVERYKELMKGLLIKANHVAIATHDDNLVNFCRSYIAEQKIPASRYEFQMLFGMRKPTWFQLANEGHGMCVYVPYGKQWMPYFRRRLMERKTIKFLATYMFRS
jgi:proline dehydrogenase